MLTLGELIDTLEAFDPGLPVRADFDHGAGLGFGSWRGDYSEPTLWEGGTRFIVDWSDDDGFTVPDVETHLSGARTVGELLYAALLAADGGVFEGYKGGMNVMGRQSPLHADPWGESQGRRVTGVKVVDGVVWLTTCLEEM